MHELHYIDEATEMEIMMCVENKIQKICKCNYLPRFAMTLKSVKVTKIG